MAEKMEEAYHPDNPEQLLEERGNQNDDLKKEKQEDARRIRTFEKKRL